VISIGEYKGMMDKYAGIDKYLFIDQHTGMAEYTGMMDKYTGMDEYYHF